MTISASNQGIFGAASLGYLSIGLTFGLSQFYMLNVAMQYFDQVAIMPIYECFLILTSILTGAVIMQDYRMYNWQQFLMLLVCSIICIIGVFILVKKPAILNPKPLMATPTLESQTEQGDSLLNNINE